MKALICFIVSFMLVFSVSFAANAATKKVCSCKYSCKYVKTTKHKHKKKTHHYRTYYSPGCCKEYATACGSEMVCYPGHYYKCKTEFSYRSGKNSARVEVCR